MAELVQGAGVRFQSERAWVRIPLATHPHTHTPSRARARGTHAALGRPRAPLACVRRWPSWSKALDSGSSSETSVGSNPTRRKPTSRGCWGRAARHSPPGAKLRKRASRHGGCPGIEPGTSCTRSKNHTTRPTSRAVCRADSAPLVLSGGWTCSSAGRSAGLVSRKSRVRCPPGPQAARDLEAPRPRNLSFGSKRSDGDPGCAIAWDVGQPDDFHPRGVGWTWEWAGVESDPRAPPLGPSRGLTRSVGDKLYGSPKFQGFPVFSCKCARARCPGPGSNW